MYLEYSKKSPLNTRFTLNTEISDSLDVSFSLRLNTMILIAILAMDLQRDFTRTYENENSFLLIT